MSHIIEINNLADLSEYREAWQELLAQTPCATFFQTPEWLEVYWQHFGANQKLRLLVIKDSGTVTGLLPLVIRREQTKLGRLRFATYPMDHWGSFYGPIGSDPMTVLSTGLDYLKSKKRDWDVLEPRWVGAYEGEYQATEQVLNDHGFAPVPGDITTTGIIDLGGTWDDYLASRDSKWRNNARRWERQINNLGEVEHERIRTQVGEDAEATLSHYEECLRIARVSWQGSSTTGTTLTHDSVAAFLRDVHLAAARTGCLDLNLLRLDGKAIAFTYNYVYRGNVFSLRSGFDPAIKVKGAGSLLYVKAIEDSFARGDYRYDLGPRHMEIKRKLITHAMPVYRLSCFARWSVQQQLLRLRRTFQAVSVPLPELGGLPSPTPAL